MIIQIDVMLNNALDQEQQLIAQLAHIERQRLETDRKLWAARGQIDLLKTLHEQAAAEETAAQPAPGAPNQQGLASAEQRALAQRPDVTPLQPLAPDVPDQPD